MRKPNRGSARALAGRPGHRKRILVDPRPYVMRLAGL